MSGLRLGPFPVTSGADLNMWTVALESPAERSNYVSLSYYHNLQLLYIIRTLCSESLVYLSRPTNIEKWEEEGQDGWRLWGWHVPDGGDAWGRGRRNNSLQGANLGAGVWRLGRGLIFANCVTGTNPNYQVKPGQAGHYVSWYFVWKGHALILFYFIHIRPEQFTRRVTLIWQALQSPGSTSVWVIPTRQHLDCWLDDVEESFISSFLIILFISSKCSQSS